jgi:rhodanese-related sulfurtransferase
MGFPNVYVVDGGTQAWLASGQALESGRTTKDAAGYDEGLQSGDLPFGYQEASVQVESLTPSALQERLNSPQPPVVVFTDTSGEFSSGHVPGAYWLSRSWLELQIAEVVPHQATPVVLVSADGQNAMLAGGTLKALGYQHVAVLTGGMRAWRQADLPVEKGLTGVTSMPHDVMVMGPERNWADAIEYLRWEEELGRKYETHLA